ncbi:Orotate phosphoribosyltransferase [Candidatus Providencia siddallii]|uniref:Orotate phosphoribosyltransferase n=1 Tax=Candidatus Providencia siddallii TaxID=1715285 RepID=A0A0M6WAK7_9GAMM|nr:Orotate phosphoribosyltransferase [Candidatus Providencia siddallii]
MKDYQYDFINFALKKQVLKFGDFILKSGRKSPYFLNSGLFNTGSDLLLIGSFYAQLLLDSLIKYDVILGLAYKGIPIVTAMVIALKQQYGINISYCFNRKNIKKYGECGVLIGSPLKGHVVIVDDVITAGTSIRESIKIINQQNVKISGALICFDRQEKGKGEISATKEIERDYCKVYSIVTINDLIVYLSNSKGMEKHLIALNEYREKYCIYI